ncbi:MAG: BatA domain-containing protein [Verrucomicrobiales bacterium]|nr:BatA domain-containing protein [Verrucomicrobiales bacterium]
MSFLQPILLIGLPLALLPIVIHLINQHRHRTVQWAAMMFLLDAKKMTKGMARLRQILILAMRVIAVMALLFAASRPLAGGWLALTGGKADTVLILLDRSASMEQQNLETGLSKRGAALDKISDLIEKTGKGSEIILIDSATLTPTQVASAAALTDLPQTFSTSTGGNIPALFEKALEYLATDESGRTDIWLASDLRQSDWQTGSGQWQTIRSELSAKETVRLFLLTYPRAGTRNLSISATNVERRRTPQGFQLVMDLTIRRQSENSADDTTVPVEFTINGTRTVEEMKISGEEMVRLGHVMPLGKADGRGWGRIDLPADDNPADNTAYFVFDDEAVRKTVVVSNDLISADAIRAAAASALDASKRYEALVLSEEQTARIPWEETALLFWQIPVPEEGSPEAALLRQHVDSGRTLVFLPPEETGSESFSGFLWADFLGKGEAVLETGWWRTESGLLANTRNGNPLPVGDLSLFQARLFEGEAQALLKLESGETVLARLVTDTPGSVYIWGTLPRPDYSTLASDGIAFFVMIHRALEEGTNAVSPARFGVAGVDLPSGGVRPSPLDEERLETVLNSPGLVPAAYEMGSEDESKRLLALNRPASEDDLRVVAEEGLTPLLEGVEFRQITDEVDSGSSLASEVWRAFLVAMALALLAEAALCLPPVPEGKEDILSKHSSP